MVVGKLVRLLFFSLFRLGSLSGALLQLFQLGPLSVALLHLGPLSVSLSRVGSLSGAVLQLLLLGHCWPCFSLLHLGRFRPCFNCRSLDPGVSRWGASQARMRVSGEGLCPQWFASTCGPSYRYGGASGVEGFPSPPLLHHSGR